MDHLVRFPLVHQATFKLSEAPHWLAFAMCTVGGLNPSETKMKDGMGGEYTFRDSGAPWDGVQSIVRAEVCVIRWPRNPMLNRFPLHRK